MSGPKSTKLSLIIVVITTIVLVVGMGSRAQVKFNHHTAAIVTVISLPLQIKKSDLESRVLSASKKSVKRATCKVL